MTKSSAGAASNIACPFEDPGRSKKAIAVGPKILTAVGATCLTILVFTACVVAQQRSEIEQGAVMKARNLARAVAYRATAGAGSRQAYVQGLGDLYKRDFVIVDRQKKGLADADAAEVGQVYGHDPGNEVGRTIVDGQARTFTEQVPDKSAGLAQVTVPTHARGSLPRAMATGRGS